MLLSLSLRRTRYVKCLYVYNKVDMISIEDMDKLAREKNSIVVSVHMKLNLQALLVSHRASPPVGARYVLCVVLPGAEGSFTYVKQQTIFGVGSVASEQYLYVLVSCFPALKWTVLWQSLAISRGSIR